jgi:hypothetical protein
MNITAKEFIKGIKSGKTERELNLITDPYISQSEVNKLIRFGHTNKSAKEHLSTDYSNGFTICSECGSYYTLGKGFTKHISKGCVHCEGEAKHRCYHVEASTPQYGGFPARMMCVMFDDGMSYCKAKLNIETFKAIV